VEGILLNFCSYCRYNPSANFFLVAVFSNFTVLPLILMIDVNDEW